MSGLFYFSMEACLLKAETLNEGGKRRLACVVAGKSPDDGPVAHIHRPGAMEL